MLSIRHLRDVDAGPVGSDLGPSLVRRGADRSVAIFGVVLGAALVLMVIPVAPDWATPGLLDRPRDLGAAIMAAAGLAVVAAGFVKIGLDRGAYVDVCERGVRRVRRGRESVVRLEDVEELIYEQARRYANGAYADSREVLTLRPGARGRPITLKRRWRETTGFATDYVESTPMRRASERIARAIGARMAERLARGESVDWTSRMRLVPGGVEVAWRPWLERTPFELVRALVSPRAWLDRWRRPWTRLAWDEVDRVEVERGIFSLRARGGRRPCVEVPTGSPNFFPGLLAAAPSLARDLIPSAPRDDRPAALTVRFTPTADDHVGLYRDLVRSTPLGRRDLWRRTLGRTAILAGIAVMICLSMRDDGLIDDRSLPRRSWPWSPSSRRSLRRCSSSACGGGIASGSSGRSRRPIAAPSATEGSTRSPRSRSPSARRAIGSRTHATRRSWHAWARRWRAPTGSKARSWCISPETSSAASSST